LVCAATQNAAGQPSAGGAGPRSSAAKPSRVVVVHDPQATDAFKPDPERVRHMTQRAITNLTGRPTPAAAWASLVNPKDVVGIKVFSTPDLIRGLGPPWWPPLLKGCWRLVSATRISLCG
jgi:hypothetical protein